MLLEHEEKREETIMNNLTAVDSTTLSQEQVIVDVLKWRPNGRISDATAYFADEFQFKDYGIGLEFQRSGGDRRLSGVQAHRVQLRRRRSHRTFH